MGEGRFLNDWRLWAVLAACAAAGAGCNAILGNSAYELAPIVDTDAGDGSVAAPDANGGADGAREAGADGAHDAGAAGDATMDGAAHVPEGGDSAGGADGEGGTGPSDGGGAGDAGDGGDSGEAGVTCPTGQTACGGACADLTSDTVNCGMCGHGCGALMCHASQCVQLVVSGGAITATVALPLRGVVANVADALSTDLATSLTSTIDWGDGTAAGFGSLSGGSGAFSLAGTHTYAAAGTVTVTVVVNDPGTGASASVMLTADVRPMPTLDGFDIPTANAFPSDIALATDENLWFVENGANQIGRITTAGTIREFVIPTMASNPGGITGSADGEVWFTEGSANQLGQIVPSSILATGQILEYPLGSTSPMDPGSIVSGPDGNLWMGFANPGIGTFVPGTMAFTSNPNASPSVLCSGPDGNVWFTDVLGNQIGKVTPAGVVTEFPVTSPGSQPYGIARGPDGNLWFTENVGNAIGRMTPAGVCTEFPLPTDTSLPKSIVAGPDGNLWFLEAGAENVGRITTTGAITEIPIPVMSQTAGVNSNGLGVIALGSGGNLWFTEIEGERIGRLTP